ncbi:MAG: hypothetical protein K2Q03_05970 [Sphingobacteriaceae bacterium]|nr:hypothetical protein [Sphingobacteriaceae bacterium]
MKTLVKNSLVGRARAEKRGIVAEVLDLLDWTVEMYCDYHWSVYEEFFGQRFEGYPVVMAELMANPVMQGWWRMEELKRSKELLDFVKKQAQSEAYVTEGGELVMLEGAEYDSTYWNEEYVYVNSVDGLLNNAIFLEGYDQVLNLIIEQK